MFFMKSGVVIISCPHTAIAELIEANSRMVFMAVQNRAELNTFKPD